MDKVVVKDIYLQAERDNKLMAEYGALYGHKCVIWRKTGLFLMVQ